MVHSTAQQVVSRRGKDEDGYEICINENARAKSAKLQFCIVKFENL